MTGAPGPPQSSGVRSRSLIVGGERIKLQAAHIKLSHSRAFRVFKGVPSCGISNNMWMAVDLGR